MTRVAEAIADRVVGTRSGKDAAKERARVIDEVRRHWSTEMVGAMDRDEYRAWKKEQER